jgi:glycosyltransferase involved in cell wall biosynthesis
MRNQVYKDFVHIVVGDGPQENWVERDCREYGCHYFNTPVRENAYGAGPCNAGIDLIESGKLGPIDYVLFLDDDNILLELALYNINMTAEKNGRPPLIWQDILFSNRYYSEYFILPKCGEPLTQGDWDSLNCIIRTDLLNNLRFQPTYIRDYLMSVQLNSRADNKWVKAPGVGGIHFLSWDT